MKNFWIYKIFLISLIFAFRIFASFMLLPVLSIYGQKLANSTPALIGIALGSYGLTQGLLQLPFGILSDYISRKKVILLGLCLFLIGSIWGAFATSIWGIIGARIIQGSGAIGSVLIALLSDFTPETHRARAMAIMGISISFAFLCAMILSPIITAYYSLSGVFSCSIILAVISIIIASSIKSPATHKVYPTNLLENIKSVLKNKSMQPLNIGIFIQHFIFTATFYAIPILLYKEKIKSYYIPLIVISMVIALFLIYKAERQKKIPNIFKVAIYVTFIMQFLLIFVSNIYLLLLSLIFIYFTAFNFLEANLPALISKKTTLSNKGTAMGIYSTSQFLGIFAGGTAAGFAFSLFNVQGIFLLNACIAGFWILVNRAKTV